jgi:O-acetyl-ADP-ribose deacetylase (regulator of RNase III)
MELILVDEKKELVNCWRKEFDSFPEVKILYGNILEEAENTIVSPGNSYGYMDGGIDLKYIGYFGTKLQKEVSNVISFCPEKLVPVGTSLVVDTYNKKIPYLIYSPTMEIPGMVDAKNSFYAMFSTLRTASKYPDSIKKVFCPGLATGIGNVSFDFAAREMALAYNKWKFGCS